MAEQYFYLNIYLLFFVLESVKTSIQVEHEIFNQLFL